MFSYEIGSTHNWIGYIRDRVPSLFSAYNCSCVCYHPVWSTNYAYVRPENSRYAHDFDAAVMALPSSKPRGVINVKWSQVTQMVAMRGPMITKCRVLVVTQTRDVSFFLHLIQSLSRTRSSCVVEG